MHGRTLLTPVVFGLLRCFPCRVTVYHAAKTEIIKVTEEEKSDLFVQQRERLSVTAGETELGQVCANSLLLLFSL